MTFTQDPVDSTGNSPFGNSPFGNDDENNTALNADFGKITLRKDETRVRDVENDAPSNTSSIISRINYLPDTSGGDGQMNNSYNRKVGADENDIT